MLVTGESPFAGDNKQETFLNVSQVSVDYSRDTFSRVSELAVDFIRKLLVKVPEWVEALWQHVSLSWSSCDPSCCLWILRDRPSAAECLSHPWLWQLCLSPDLVATRLIRERTSGSKWAAPPEDPEDKENFLESPYTKRFRFEEMVSAEFCWRRKAVQDRSRAIPFRPF